MWKEIILSLASVALFGVGAKVMLWAARHYRDG